MYKEKTKKCSILIGSCDSYSDLWDIFFDLFEKFWPDNEYDIYLSTESSNYSRKNIKIINLNPKDEKCSWTKRIYEAVEAIDSKSILFILDDFFLYDYVKTKKVKDCVEWINKDQKIVSFTFWPISNDGTISNTYKDFILRPSNSNNKVSAVLAIWSKFHLLKYLKNHDINAWEWEREAIKQSINEYSNDEFYCTLRNDSQIFPYDFTKYGLFSGQWFRETVQLFNKINIKCDFSKRGFFDESLRGLQKSIESVFELNSKIIPWYGLSNNNIPFFSPDSHTEDNYFVQKYMILNSYNIIRWEPAIQWGFGIDNLNILIKYKNGMTKKINKNEIFGNYIFQKQRIIFNNPGPYLYIYLGNKYKISELIISGVLVMPLSSIELKNSFKKQSRPKTLKQKRAFNLFWNQYLTIPEKVEHILMDSIFDAKTKKGNMVLKPSNVINFGMFEQKYEVNDLISFSWVPSTTGGYSIKNLLFQYCINNKYEIIPNSELINLPKPIGNEFIFLSNTPIKWKNEKKLKIDYILISGEFNKPIQAKVLKKYIWPKQISKGENMKADPKVSIVIPVYNKQKENYYLSMAIDSALSQDYENIEVIVINDGSDDNDISKNIALSYGDKIKYYEKENGGVSTALNVAIEKMTGDYFSWLSHDDVYLNDKISTQINYLKENNLLNSDIILYSDYELIDKDSKHISDGIKNHEELVKKPEYSLLRGNINGLTLLIPKKAFNKCGLFDEKLRAVQDYELWNRMIKKYEFIHIPKILVKSRYHSTQVSNTSPYVISEGNEFWLKMIKELSSEKKVELEGSEYNFYLEMAAFLKQTPYDLPLKYCEEKINELINLSKQIASTKSVDIIIPFLNREEETIRAVYSALLQTHKNNTIFLINDGSSEDLTSLKNLIKLHDNIKLIEFSKNKGASVARNKGIELATADYIAFLDSDDEFFSTKIEKQLSKMILTNSKISHTSYLRNLEGERTIITSGKDSGYINKKLIYSCHIATPTVMIETNFLKQNNYKYDSKAIIGEDVCFYLELLKNEQLLGIDEPLSIVNANQNSSAYNIEKQILGYKTILKYILNDSYYSNFDEELLRLIEPLSIMIKQKSENEKKQKNNSDIPIREQTNEEINQFNGNIILRNCKKLVTYTKYEGTKNTLVRAIKKVKKKLKAMNIL